MMNIVKVFNFAWKVREREIRMPSEYRLTALSSLEVQMSDNTNIVITKGTIKSVSNKYDKGEKNVYFQFRIIRPKTRPQSLWARRVFRSNP